MTTNMTTFIRRTVGARAGAGLRGRVNMKLVGGLILCLCWHQPAWAQANDGLWKTYMEAGRKAQSGKNYDEAERLYRLAESKAATFGELDERYVNTLANMVGLYVSQKKNVEAETTYTKLLSILEKGAGGASLDSASLVRSLGHLFNNEKRYREAEPLYRHALAICRRGVKPGDVRVTPFLSSLGNNYYLREKYDEAEAAIKEELAILERDPVLSKQMDIVYPLGYLGLIAQQSQKYGEAEQYMRRAIDTAKIVRGENHPETGSMLKALGLVLRRQPARYGDAVKVMQQAMQIDEAVYGKASREVASDLDFEAGVHRIQANYAEAERLLVHALEIVEGIPATLPSEFSTLLYHLADTHSQQRKYAEGAADCKRLRRLFEQRSHTGPENDLLLNDCLENIYFKSGNYVAEAETLKSSAAIAEKLGAWKETELAGKLTLLAGSYLRQQKYEDAYAALQRAEKIYGKNPSTPNTTFLYTMARYYYFTGKYADSEPLFLKAVRLAEQRNDVDSELEAAIYRRGHALSLYAQGKTAEAENVFRQAVDKIKTDKVGGERDAGTSYHELATLLAARGRPAEAESLFRQAVELRERALGAEHPELASSLESYAALLRAGGRGAEAAPLEARALAIRGKQTPR